jgi:hypothetical protein
MDPRYLPLIPGGQYGQDMGDQVAGAYKRGGVGAAAGTALRSATAIPLAVGADVMRPAMPVWDAAAQGLKTFVTGDSTPINGSPAAAMPPKTQNAVAITNAQNADSQSDRARGKAQAPGQSQAPSPDATGAVSPGGLPYFTRPTSQPNIERIDAKGQSPLFTNMGGAGLDDLSKKGAQLPSVPGFLAGVPTFGAGAGANVGGVAMAPAAGGGGALSALYSRINDYQDRADKLLNSSGIVSQFRGRQLLRARARLIGDVSSLSNADAATTNAGASLALTGVAQQRANEEGQQNVASNLLRSQEIASTNRAHELGFLPRMEDAVRGQRYQQAALAGDSAEAARIAQESRFAPQARNPTMQFNPTGSHVLVLRPGENKPRAFKVDDLMNDNSATKEALSRTAAGR